MAKQYDLEEEIHEENLRIINDEDSVPGQFILAEFQIKEYLKPKDELEINKAIAVLLNKDNELKIDIQKAQQFLDK